MPGMRRCAADDHYSALVRSFSGKATLTDLLNDCSVRDVVFFFFSTRTLSFLSVSPFGFMLRVEMKTLEMRNAIAPAGD